MNYKTKLLLDEALRSGYLDERIKLAFKVEPAVKPPEYKDLVDRVVRMPGPLDTPKKTNRWVTPAPTEVSKSFAQKQLSSSGAVGNIAKGQKEEGIA